MSQMYTLKAMAHNYSNGHSWDHLDSEVCTKAAEEIKKLQEERDEGLAREAELLREVEYLRERLGGHKSLCTKHAELLKDREVLQEQLVEAEKNAARYQKLRNNCYHAHVQVMQPDGEFSYVYGDELDKSLELVPINPGCVEGENK